MLDHRAFLIISTYWEFMHVKRSHSISPLDPLRRSASEVTAKMSGKIPFACVPCSKVPSGGNGAVGSEANLAAVQELEGFRQQLTAVFLV